MFSAISLCSNLCVGPLPRIKISLFILPIFVDELISTPKIITFLSVLELGCVKNPCLSNSIRYPEYIDLSILAFLFKLTAPNKQFSSIE